MAESRLWKASRINPERRYREAAQSAVSQRPWQAFKKGRWNMMSVSEAFYMSRISQLTVRVAVEAIAYRGKVNRGPRHLDDAIKRLEALQHLQALEYAKPPRKEQDEKKDAPIETSSRARKRQADS